MAWKRVLCFPKSINRALMNFWIKPQKGAKEMMNNNREMLRLHVKKWGEETAEHANNLQEFFNWFDAAKSPQESYMSGWWDFSFHILKPKLLALLGEPYEKTALEIGYGAARLMVPACHYFNCCIGIDVHPFKDKVGELIRERGVSNFTLYQTDGAIIPLDNESVDFIYSFIVLHHLPTIEALQDYLAEIYRVMKLGSVAILYMGFLPSRFRQRYIDLSTRSVTSTRQVTLQLTIPLASVLLKTAGFRIVDVRRSQKKPWRIERGGQFYAIIEK